MGKVRKKKIKKHKNRNPIIASAFKGEINLCTKVYKDKTKYTRKKKHKNSQ